MHLVVVGLCSASSLVWILSAKTTFPTKKDQQSAAQSISMALPKFLHKSWTALLCCLTHLPPTRAAAWASRRPRYRAVGLLQPLHPFGFKIGLEGINKENNANGAVLNNRIYVSLMLAKSHGLCGTVHHVQLFVSICLCIILSKWFFPPVRLSCAWDLQSQQYRKSNVTWCVPSISSSSFRRKGENENKLKHPSKTMFLLHQNRWLCDARGDFWDIFTENSESLILNVHGLWWF